MKNRFKQAAISLALSMAVVAFHSTAATSDSPMQPVSDTFNSAQEAAIGRIAADYLVDHPEVLLEVSKKLQARQAEQKSQAMNTAVLHGRSLLMQLDGVPVKGPADAKVIVTEFFDYECIACSMMAPNMEQVMAKNPNVRFAFRDWTIFAPRYPESTQASRRGLDIWHQKGADAYMAYHNGIYRTGHNEGKLTADDIESVAKSAGAGPENLEARPQYDSLIEGNDTLAGVLGLTGTPGIVVMPAENATMDSITVFAGVATPEMMQQAIDKAMR